MKYFSMRTFSRTTDVYDAVVRPTVLPSRFSMGYLLARTTEWTYPTELRQNSGRMNTSSEISAHAADDMGLMSISPSRIFRLSALG